MRAVDIRRRHVLALAAASPLLFATRTIASSAVSADRVVVLNAALAQSLVALGAEKFGMTDRWAYENTVIEPKLPAGVLDVGSEAEPNLELLSAIRPSVFLYSDGLSPDPAILRRIAPVIDVPLLTSEGGNGLDSATRMLRRVASIIGRDDAANEYLRTLESSFAQRRNELRHFRGQPVICMTSPSRQGTWAFCKGSLIDGVLQKLGLKNAVLRRGSEWGWDLITMRELLQMDDAFAIHLGPLNEHGSQSTPLWQALPFVRNDRLLVLPKTYPWGGLPSADRFAKLLTGSLRAQR